ncbi:metal ABC transporter ATPase [Pedobacter antarcticus 4BY]|uniref:P-type Zn(2+) transporter n=2 Tax=Pedobacter antarcticus TaxID=34086 RepID=A0A081PHF9_9SPHI|nr:heavy metal translocating P-type ATPase [Pedobacter antarcticus]KEQ30132.1 metal ABC transporter ATPase [Pedobacter antarcticus 4BY]SFE49152.1 Cd2+/Zn2+-exporting ATPase [Pedobacter antarcticus]
MCTSDPKDKTPHTQDHKEESKHVHTDTDEHDHGGGCCGGEPGWKSHLPLLGGLTILMVMLVLDYGFKIRFSQLIEFFIFGVAYLLSGYQVLNLAFRKAIRLDFFNEFFLMSVATIGAFAIGSFSEGVAVMVFYSIGEWFQDSAVDSAKRSIKALLDIRPDTVTVLRDGKESVVAPSDVQIGELIVIKAGEKVALDGDLKSAKGSFNTAALTGESKPDTKITGERILAGMINLNNAVEVTVTALFKDSKLNKILEMVQDATSRKSKTQLFISRFARVYTPIVFALAVMVVFLPFLFVGDYVFRDWLYRGLVFLVISCPCALVVSIPLGYFGGIGLASKNGILFKGSNFLDVMTTIDTVVMDKTGTLTKGVFKVQQVFSVSGDEKELIRIAATVENKSTHPIARAIVAYAGKDFIPLQVETTEVAGKGLSGEIDGKRVLAGNTALLDQFKVSYPALLKDEEETIVVVAIDNQYAGHILIADELKPDAAEAILEMHKQGLHTVMLSGDKQAVVDKIAKLLGIDEAYGGLLPEDKVSRLEQLKRAGRHIAFAGDGINDAPVVALADAGIAMGGLGSDATIETADIVIQNDQPGKIVTAIQIGRLTKKIVWQNIALAMSIKIIVLILGAGGIATLWEAVIADVGVALLAILNAVRIQNMKV